MHIIHAYIGFSISKKLHDVYKESQLLFDQVKLFRKLYKDIQFLGKIKYMFCKQVKYNVLCNLFKIYPHSLT